MLHTCYRCLQGGTVLQHLTVCMAFLVWRWHRGRMADSPLVASRRADTSAITSLRLALRDRQIKSQIGIHTSCAEIACGTSYTHACLKVHVPYSVKTVQVCMRGTSYVWKHSNREFLSVNTCSLSTAVELIIHTLNTTV